MNVLVAYATHHGSTREIAERIAGVLGDRGLDVGVEPVDRVRDVRRFDAFVVGSALRMAELGAFDASGRAPYSPPSRRSRDFRSR
jgi:menaquinone-dependent protoporphyrinogen IX oxidase